MNTLNDRKQSFFLSKRSVHSTVNQSLHLAENLLTREDRQHEVEELCRRVSRCKVFHSNDIISTATCDMLQRNGICLFNYSDWIQQYFVPVSRRNLVGIGIKNVSGGVEFFHEDLGRVVTIGNLGISVIHFDKQSHDECLLFSGLMDYLSYLTVIHRFKEIKKPICDVVIINNIYNISTLFDVCSLYKSINAFLPVGSSSDTLINTIIHLCSCKITDCSWFFHDKGFDSFFDLCQFKFGQKN